MNLQNRKNPVLSDSLRPHELHNSWNFQARILEWVAFPFSRKSSQPRDWSQVLNPGLPHCRQILYQLSHKGSQRILEWVAYPFSSGSSRLRNQTGVSCIAGRFLTSWATREALNYCHSTPCNLESSSCCLVAKSYLTVLQPQGL